MIQISDKYKKDTDGIYVRVPVPPDPGSETINVIDLEVYCPEFLRKICDILFSDDKYYEASKTLAKSILEFSNDMEYITRKQYNCVMRIPTVSEWRSMRRSFVSERTVVIRGHSIGGSDKSRDRFYKILFGHEPVFEENEVTVAGSFLFLQEKKNWKIL